MLPLVFVGHTPCLMVGQLPPRAMGCTSLTLHQQSPGTFHGYSRGLMNGSTHGFLRPRLRTTLPLLWPHSLASHNRSLFCVHIKSSGGGIDKDCHLQHVTSEAACSAHERGQRNKARPGGNTACSAHGPLAESQL